VNTLQISPPSPLRCSHFILGNLKKSFFNIIIHIHVHHLALAASASQPLKSGTLSLYLSVPVPVLILFVITSRPTTASRPSNPLSLSPLPPQIWLCGPLCAFINYSYLLTYLYIYFRLFTLPQNITNNNCCTAALAVYLLLFNASYYLHSPSTASGARYRRSACTDTDMLRPAAAACCDMG